MGTPLTPQQQEQLRNPFHNALRTHQSAFAEQRGNVLRYRPDVLPFAAVEHPNTPIDAATLRQDTDVVFVGVLPSIPADTPNATHFTCLQMAWAPTSTAPEPKPEESELGEADAADMVELTDVAFPGYYRRNTWQLGRYIGLRIDGQLVAMAGHRTRMPGLREISGVCTRPGFTGRGYAQHLIQRLLAPENAQTPDATPYLHVVSTNVRAIAIYRALQFVEVGEVPLLHIKQAAN